MGDETGDDTRSTFVEGDLLGGCYRLLRQLGRKSLFEAEDVLIRRRVVLKIGGPELVAEGRALASVRHPGLPTIFGVGTHRDAIYLALERLYGVTLEQHLARHGAGLPALDALPILIGLADALVAVTAAGMAHGDLGPSKVMLCPGDRIVLLDFGAATLQLDDVRAWGAIAFEVLAGQRFVGLGLEAIVSGLPLLLVDLVMACLADEVEDRPADATVIAGELRAIQRRAAGDTGPVRFRRRTAPALERYRSEILVVEDDEDIRDNLTELLDARGYRAVGARDGAHALDLIREGWRPALILLDLMMPRLDGQGFLETQAGDPILDGIPVVVVTAQPSERLRGFGTVRGVVPKPIALPALLQLVQDVCRERAARGGP